jgi:membrane protein YdbS with pleckstrin-like domain
MEIFLFIASTVLGACLISSIIIAIYSIKVKTYFHAIAGSIVAIICVIIGIVVIPEMKNIQPEPTALDVYRGLTELEVTSVNGVPKDTVVVYKNK